MSECFAKQWLLDKQKELMKFIPRNLSAVWPDLIFREGASPSNPDPAIQYLLIHSKIGEAGREHEKLCAICRARRADEPTAFPDIRDWAREGYDIDDPGQAAEAATDDLIPYRLEESGPVPILPSRRSKTMRRHAPLARSGT